MSVLLWTVSGQVAGKYIGASFRSSDDGNGTKDYTLKDLQDKFNEVFHWDDLGYIDFTKIDQVDESLVKNLKEKNFGFTVITSRELDIDNAYTMLFINLHRDKTANKNWAKEFKLDPDLKAEISEFEKLRFTIEVFTNMQESVMTIEDKDVHQVMSAYELFCPEELKVEFGRDSDPKKYNEEHIVVPEDSNGKIWSMEDFITQYNILNSCGIEQSHDY